MPRGQIVSVGHEVHQHHLVLQEQRRDRAAADSKTTGRVRSGETPRCHAAEMTELPVAQRWFAHQRIDDSITLLAEHHADPGARCNIWHVRGRDRDLVIDTGLGVVSLRAEIEEMTGRPAVAVATHGHFDHIGGLYEFDERAGHTADISAGLALTLSPLVAAGFPDNIRGVLEDAGYPIPDVLLTAVPDEAFDPAAFRQRPPTLTWKLDEGDVIDLGDRAFVVLHLPGHSPGSIGLWDEGDGILFSGDAIYDGGLLDEFPGADIAQYVATMHRLRALPVTAVHGGHEPSFGRIRLIELVDAYLSRREQAVSTA
jgi:glyoxylase-like metal-dependent hydrolase (beta-lactamase superfamily II)